MTGSDDEMLNTVERYKRLAENKENQAAMIKVSGDVENVNNVHCIRTRFYQSDTV